MDKAPDAFRTISEVADEIDVPQHVLRFWESRFQQIRPMKRGGGRRYYRRDDVDLLCGVRHLLYGEGYTIRGVQRILREQGAAFVQEVWRAGAMPPPPARDEDRIDDDDAMAAAAGHEPAHHGPTHHEPAHHGPARDELGRNEPRLSGPSRRAVLSAPDDGYPDGRREPYLAAAVAPQPEMAPGAPPEPPARRLVALENRRKLQAALDELLACRQIIADVLGGGSRLGRGGKDV